MIKKIYKKIFPDWTLFLEREAVGCDSVLDLACGYNSLIQYVNIPHKVGVELFPEYLEESKKKGIHNEYIQGDILLINIPAHSHDLIFCSEVIEHLEKKDGFVLLDNAEKWAKKKIIFTTPNGFLKQGEYDDNPLQIHKSGWSVEEFRERGYKVYGIGSWKILKGEQGKMKYKPYFFWKVVADIAQKIVYYFPKQAFQLMVVKEITENGK